jgi:virginiamycin B lyase
MVPVVVTMAVAMLALAVDPVRAAQVSYYAVPSGAHPHDVAPAPDGTVWYTAQAQGALGILDPRTGRTRQVSLGPESAPHGVIVGPDRAAWITDGGQNAIVRFDPATRAVKVFALPRDFADANLNTATFDRKGILWFTGQNGVYGRVDPATGKVDAWKAPKGVGPYGITTTPSGEVWYASLAGDHIAKIDTVSGDALMIQPPKPNVGPRRIWSDSKGMLWVSFWRTGEVARFDPAAKAWKVWSLPASREGCYAVYVDDRDRVWVSDWPGNALVRFDPAREKFESFPSNRARANVRQILGRKGEVWAAESGTDRLVVVRE